MYFLFKVCKHFPKSAILKGFLIYFTTIFFSLADNLLILILTALETCLIMTFG